MKKEQQEILQITKNNSMEKAIWIHGSIYKIRKMSGFAFILLRMQKEIVQCIYTKEDAVFDLEELVEESCVKLRVIRKVEPRAKRGFEFVVIDCNILSRPSKSLPFALNHKTVETSLEQLLYFRPLTLRNEKQRAIFFLQQAVVNACRNFLQEESFVEIHSPKIVGFCAEGGANIFSLDYFGKEAYLTQSPQIYKQMMVGVYERVFEIGPVFRAEKHDTKRHLNEYTGIDFEMGYIESFEDIMEMEERMLKYVFTYLNETSEAFLKLLSVTLPAFTRIPRITFEQAKCIITEQFHKQITETKDLSPSEEKLLCEWSKKTYESDFLFVTHYPEEKRPFYVKNSAQNETVTDSFDLLYAGMEITTGGQRIHSYEEQVKKMINRGMDVDNFKEYLMMHAYGMPPHGGIGIGLERLLAGIIGVDDVRYTCLFPRDIHRLIP